MREIDREIEHEAVMRLEARPLVVLSRFDSRLDSQIALGYGLLDDPGRLQQKHERTGAPVHDRDLGTRNVDVQVVDAQSGKRGHQMFYGRDPRSVLFQRRRQSGVTNIAGVGAYRHRLGQIGAVENNAGIGWCRTQHQLDAHAGVQTNAGRLDFVFERALSEHRGLGLRRGRKTPRKRDGSMV